MVDFLHESLVIIKNNGRPENIVLMRSKRQLMIVSPIIVYVLGSSIQFAFRLRKMNDIYQSLIWRVKKNIDIILR